MNTGFVSLREGIEQSLDVCLNNHQSGVMSSLSGDSPRILMNICKRYICDGLNYEEIERDVGGIVKSLFANGFNDISYWNGYLGNIQLLEILNRLDFIEIDVEPILKKIDKKLVKYSYSVSPVEEEDLPFLLAILLNRVRLSVEEDEFYKSFYVAVISICEKMLRVINNAQSYHHPRLFLFVSVLNKAAKLGFYSSPISDAITQIVRGCSDGVLKFDVAIDSLFSRMNLMYVLKMTEIDRRKIKHLYVEGVNYFLDQLKDGIYKCENFHFDYLYFLNNLILERHTFDGRIQKYLKQQLKFDIDKVNSRNAPSTIDLRQNGGVILTATSYLYPNFKSWRDLLIL